MSVSIFIVSVVATFCLGGFVQGLRMKNYAKSKGCPFKYACLQYDSTETRAAVKRVLTLLVENEVPKKEIKKLVSDSLQ